MKDSSVSVEGVTGDHREGQAAPAVTFGDLGRLESLGGLSRWTSLGTLAHLPSLPALGDLYALLDNVSQHPFPASPPPPPPPLSSPLTGVRRRYRSIK